MWVSVARLCPLAAILAVLASSGVAQGTVVAPMDLASLTRSADLIIRGAVLDTRASVSEDRRQIHTLASVRVLARQKGECFPEIHVRLPGGSAGDLTQRVAGAPELFVGDEVLLFLRRLPGEKPVYAITGFSQGKFNIVEDRKGRWVTRRPTGVAVRAPSGGVVAEPSFAPVPERELLAEIERALEKGRSR
jgi:hypothetical protein